MKWFGLCILFSLLFGASVAIAQTDGNPENWCRDGSFTRDSIDFKIAKVKGSKAARAYFHGDEADGCPESADCKNKAYLVGGNEVVVNRVRGNFACSWYTPAQGVPTVGWIRTAKLSISSPATAAGTRPWLGNWKFADNGIEFTDNKLPGFLNVTGDAIWKGVGDNVHVGEIDGRYEPTNGLIRYFDGTEEFECNMTMRLLGKYLIVVDNLKCGGVNVTFSGVYTKR